MVQFVELIGARLSALLVYRAERVACVGAFLLTALGLVENSF